MAAMRLSVDLVWLFLRRLPCDEIVRNRQLCSLWRLTVDGVAMDEWRHLFCERVCDVLHVGTGFDWRKAAVVAAVGASMGEGIEATCTWRSVIVRVRAPWSARGGSDVDAPLSVGVRRGVSSQFSHVVEYIYSDTIRLRSLGRSCTQQSIDECLNCQHKRPCLFMRYTYYLRPCVDTDEMHLDECLSRWLCDTPRTE